MMLPILTIILAMLLITAIYTDLRWSLIPNWLTLPALGLGVVVHAWLAGVEGVLFSAAGMGTGLGLFFLIYLAEGVGAGDVKLMAAIGSFVGAYGALSCACLAFVVGGVYAILAMIYQWGLKAAGQRLVYAAYGAVLPGATGWMKEFQLPFKLRYGLAIAGGTLLFLAGVQPFGG